MNASDDIVAINAINFTPWRPPDDIVVWNTVEGSLLTVIAVIGFVVNLFIVAAILSSRKLRRRVTDVLLCHLSLVGLVTCALLLPANVGAAFADGWPLRDGGICDAHGYTQAVMVHVMVWTIAMFGWNKYRTISIPLQHVSAAVKRQRIAAILLPTWITGLTLACVPLMFRSDVGSYRYGPAIAACVYQPSYSDAPTAASIVYSVATTVLGFLLPVGLTAHSYFRIYSIARWHRKRIAVMSAVVHVITLSVGVPMSGHGLPAEVSRPSETRNPAGAGDGGASGAAGAQCWDGKASRNVLAFVAAMLLCYAPHYLLIAASPVVRRSTFPTSSPSSWRFPVPVEALSGIAVLISPAVNGFVYGVRNRAIIRAFRRFIRPPTLAERLTRHLVSNV